MKTVVIFASKNGYTRECAQQVARGLGSKGHEVQIADIRKDAKSIDLDSFGTVVIGGGVHAGSISGALRRYCAKHEAQLKTKRLGLFVCGTDVEHQEKQISDSFPQSLFDVAVAKGWFGGRIIFEEQKGIMRFMLKKILKGEKDVHEERPEAVETFISALSQA